MYLVSYHTTSSGVSVTWTSDPQTVPPPPLSFKSLETTIYVAPSFKASAPGTCPLRPVIPLSHPCYCTVLGRSRGPGLAPHLTTSGNPSIGRGGAIFIIGIYASLTSLLEHGYDQPALTWGCRLAFGSERFLFPLQRRPVGASLWVPQSHSRAAIPKVCHRYVGSFAFGASTMVHEKSNHDCRVLPG